jgi:hypothetical protein
MVKLADWSLFKCPLHLNAVAAVRYSQSVVFENAVSNAIFTINEWN